MGRLQSLKTQIRHDVFRLFGFYILGVTSIILLLAIYGIFFYQQAQFKHYKALIVTRLNSEISASFRQAHDLARSTEVWTGLTDSVGGGSYLLPLLAKANQNNHCKFDLLDYQGRFFMHSGYAAGLKLDTPANIQRTIEDSGTHLELVPINQTELLVATVPIVANFIDSTIGLVLMHIDLGQIMATLNFPADLAIQYSLEPFEESVSDFSTQSEGFKFEWSADGKNHAIYLQLQQSYASALVFVLTGHWPLAVCCFWGSVAGPEFFQTAPHEGLTTWFNWQLTPLKVGAMAPSLTTPVMKLARSPTPCKACWESSNLHRRNRRFSPEFSRPRPKPF
jgi:hypothetical protein